MCQIIQIHEIKAKNPQNLILKFYIPNLRVRYNHYLQQILIWNQTMQPEQIQPDAIITYTYSPNWYRPQCLVFLDDGNCYYCSNYTIYQYSTSQRAIIKDLSMRSIALNHKQMGINAKNMKVQCLAKFTHDQQEIVVAGLNQPYLVFINAVTFQLIKIIKIDKFQNGINGIENIPTQDKLIIWNQEDYIVHLSGQKYEVMASLTASQKIKDVKIMDIHGKFYVFLVTNRGQIQIIDSSLDITHAKFTGQQLNFSNHILSMDIYFEANKLTIGILSRNKATLNFLSQYTIQYQKEQEKFVLQKHQQTINIEVKIIYPKVFAQKLKKSFKSAMTLKMLSSTEVILTGKLGQLFVIDLSAFVVSASKKENQNQVMVVKPHTMEQIEDWLYICDDPKHYKQIYGVYLCRRQQKTKMYMVGTDQILSEWEVNRFKGKIDFRSLSTLKFLTSQVQSFFHCEADPKILYVLLRDGIVRSCSPLSAVSYYLQEYWKFTKKFKVIKCVAHPTQSGILGFVTECGKILLYDVLQDRLMRIIEIDKNKTGKNIINITFQSDTIMKPIQLLELAMNKEGVEDKKWKKCDIKVNVYYQREEAKDIGILVQLLDKFVFIGHSDTDQFDDKNDKKLNKFVGYQIKRYCKVQRIHNTKLWDHQTMVFSQPKAGLLKTWIIFNSKIGFFETKLNYNSSRSIFKLVSTPDHKLLLIFQFKNKKIMLTTINLKNIQFQSDLDAIGKEIEQLSKNQEDEIEKVELDSPIHIEQMVLDYWANQLIVYNQKEDILGYLDFQAILNQNYKLPVKFECLGVSSKIETVSFYEQKYLAIGFKDQSIKILPVNHLRTEGDYQSTKNNKKVQHIQKEEDWVDCD